MLELEQTSNAAVVVSAHPDDDVLAIGDLLRALDTGGTPLHAVVATDGERSAPETAFGSAEALGRLRRDELRRAYQNLGIAPSLTWLAIPDGDVTRHESDVARHLRQIVTPETLDPRSLAPRRPSRPRRRRPGCRRRCNPRRGNALGVPGLGMALGGARRRRLSLVPRPAMAVCRFREEAARHRCFATQVRPVGEASSPTGPVLPAAVLDRFHRSFEVVFT